MSKQAFFACDSLAQSVLACGSYFETFFSACGTASIFAASKSDPDTYTFDEAMANAHCENWIFAAQTEIKQLEEHKAWIEVP